MPLIKQRRVCALALLALTLGGPLAPGVSHAQGSSTASAREVAKQGIEAFEAGDYRVAVEKLGAAFEVVRVPTVGLFRARALVKLGRLVEASEQYRDAAQLENPQGDRVTQKNAQEAAAREREELLPRIPKLTVQVKGASSRDVTFQVDGRAVPGALLGAGHLVDPGEVTVSGTLGEETRTARVSVREGQSESVILEFTGVTRAQAAPATTAAPTPAVSSSSSKPLAETSSTGSLQRTLGWVGVGVGAVGIGLGVYSAVSANDTRKELDAGGCKDAHCYSDQSGQVADYNSAVTLSTVSFGVGAALAVGGVVLLLTAPSEGSAGPEVTAWFGGRSAGLRGRF
jgi:hypothetical protein